MPALKLFVSHSSRLDDVEHKYTDRDRNWKLLKATCKAIKNKYGDKVDILVDHDGLIPGDQWNHKLNLWLAECHVAIILFSKRAIEKSDWVKKEAAILSWRAELDDKFKLIPVLLDGETKPEDLAKDFFGTLRVGDSQCVRNASTARQIVAGLERQLGKPENLPPPHSTPLDRLREGIAKLLSERTTQDSLLTALQAVGCAVPLQINYADWLARHYLDSSNEEPHACFSIFQQATDSLEPKPGKALVDSLFKAIRSLWVDPRAAACLPMALQHRKPIVLAGEYINSSDPELIEVRHFTLDRYRERAWVGSNLFFDTVTLTRFDSFEEAQRQVRETVLDPVQLKCAKPEWLDGWINEEKMKILIIATPEPNSLPDAGPRAVLAELARTYPRAVVILDLGFEHGPLPADVEEVPPQLEPGREQKALFKERTAFTFINRFGD